MATGKESIRAQTERILANASGTRSLHGSQFNKIVIEPFVISTGASQDFIYEFCCDGYAEAEALLNSFIEGPKGEDTWMMKESSLRHRCGSKEAQFIELRIVGSVKVQGGVPIFHEKKGSVRDYSSLNHTNHIL